MNLQRAIDQIVRGLGDFLGQARLGGPGAIIRAFREAGAVTPQRAQRFHAHSAFEEASFRHLLQTGVIRQASAGRYYLNERALREPPPVDINAMIVDLMRNDDSSRA